MLKDHPGGRARRGASGWGGQALQGWQGDGSESFVGTAEWGCKGDGQTCAEGARLGRRDAAGVHAERRRRWAWVAAVEAGGDGVQRVVRDDLERAPCGGLCAALQPTLQLRVPARRGSVRQRRAQPAALRGLCVACARVRVHACACASVKARLLPHAGQTEHVQTDAALSTEHAGLGRAGLGWRSLLRRPATQGAGCFCVGLLRVLDRRHARFAATRPPTPTPSPVPRADETPPMHAPTNADRGLPPLCGEALYAAQRPAPEHFHPPPLTSLPANPISTITTAVPSSHGRRCLWPNRILS
ncbi:hypothetical protein PSPO01_13336 [Paraphaeosphaeria sporulosa]